MRAGMNVFVASPHSVNAETVSLNFNSNRGFGHYNAEFVDWVVENGVVGEGRPALRAATQPIYDAYVKRVARIYYVAYQDLAAAGFPQTTPEGIVRDYARFLEGGAVPESNERRFGSFSTLAFDSLSERLLPDIQMPINNEYHATYDFGIAFGFWVRRRADGTQQHWHDGLVRLLETYDGAWLAAR